MGVSAQALCLTCLLTMTMRVMIMMPKPVSSLEGEPEDLFVGPVCNTKQEPFTDETTSVTLVCYMSVKEETEGENSIDGRLAWYDGNTREVLDGSSPLSFNWGNGWLEIRLQYTSIFRISDHGKQFICVNDFLNKSCTVELDFIAEATYCYRNEGDWYGETRSISLICRIILRKANSTAISSPASQWLVWYDGDTDEAIQESTAIVVDDDSYGQSEITLALTRTFHVSEHGRQFYCTDQFLNRTCAVELDLSTTYNFWCGIDRNKFYREHTTITLGCYLEVTKTNSSATSLPASQWLVWYDGETDEAIQESTAIVVDDYSYGRWRIDLELTRTFHVSEHGRQFYCTDQFLNRTCAVELDLSTSPTYNFQCWIERNKFYREHTRITLGCDLEVTKTNSSATRWPYDERLLWIDAETNKVSNDSRWEAYDYGDTWYLRLDLTSTFGVSEHGKEFICLDHYRNTSCTVTLDLLPSFGTRPHCEYSAIVVEDSQDQLWCWTDGDNVTDSRTRVPPEEWLTWYDSDTGEVANYSTSMYDRDDGLTTVELTLRGINSSDNGRLLICLNQITNETCITELTVTYNVAMFKSVRMLRYEDDLGETVDGNSSSCLTLLDSVNEWTWWKIDLKEEFIIRSIRLHVPYIEDSYSDCGSWYGYWDRRWLDIVVSISIDSSTDGVERSDACYNYDNVYGDRRICILEIGCYDSTPVRFVTVHLKLNDAYNHELKVFNLTVCEIEVRGNAPIIEETTTPELTTSANPESSSPELTTMVDTTPFISEVSPQYGPQAGGTLVTLKGNNLHRDNDIVSVQLISTVQLADILLETVSQNSTSVVARTQSLPSYIAPNEKLSFRITFASGLEAELSSDFTFEYRGNPEIESIVPLEAIAKGGIQLTVRGKSFDSVPEPIMVIRAEHKTTKKKYYSACAKESAEILICLSPTIDEYFLKLHRSKRDVDETQDKVEYYISFLLDGVQDYNEENFAVNVPKYSKLEIIVDPPKLKQWDEAKKVKAGGILAVWAQEGEDLQAGCTINDYTVDIDRGKCSVLALHANNLRCRTPTNKTGLGNNGDGTGNLRVILKIGKYSNFVGYLRYESEESLDEKTWSLIASGVVLLLLILCGIVIFILTRRRSRRRRQKMQANNRRHRMMQRGNVGPSPIIDLNQFQKRRAAEKTKRLMSTGLQHTYLNPADIYLHTGISVGRDRGMLGVHGYLQPLPFGRGLFNPVGREWGIFGSHGYLHSMPYKRGQYIDPMLP